MGTKTDVRTVPRAMGKLLKEAERVKLILSANTDCFAQVENVMEDIDFKEPVSREQLMELAADLMPRVSKPIEQALSTAGMAMENIDQVILVGGGSRVPKVQEILTDFVGSELGKSLNTDESAAMGAVYKAADLSTGFKVKKFLTKDAVVFPIDVDFSRALEGEEGVKKVRRTLFGRMNPYPQKKIMTFNKHQADFTFYVNYADMDYLGKAEVENVGSMNLTSVLVKGVKEALDKNLVGDNIETKGVKATSSWTTVASSRSPALNQHLRRPSAPRSRRLRRPRRTGIRRTSLSTGRSLGTPSVTISSRRVRREKKTLRRRRLQRISLKKQ